MRRQIVFSISLVNLQALLLLDEIAIVDNELRDLHKQAGIIF